MDHKKCNFEHMCNLPDMVCLDKDKITCRVYDKTLCSTQKKLVFQYRPSSKIENLFSDVARSFSYENFDLILQPDNEDDSILLNDKKSIELREISSFTLENKNIIVLMPPGSWEKNPKKKIFIETRLPSLMPPMPVEQSSDDDLALGASASPTETPPQTKFYNDMSTPLILPIAPAVKKSFNCSNDDKKIFNQIKSSSMLSPPPSSSSSSSSSSKPNSGYVGLVNQAMTCYLNSLLQALFMTPEFRNALYKMKFNEKDKSIPFQLQKLFVNLQTSTKIAVETTDLTKSFGWDSTQAWTQHDIQELCRVMFDALEKEFQRTKQENWINKFYEGKMIDYVKCLECGIEKSREDTFLDIPLPLRPFGTNKAYESVEDALKAFVQPETLDGNNQYFCEKCNKKCDAHKGLKFIDFPYILTLHLKRFDFDYQTLHRIKLNDRVTFCQTLDLNWFINAKDKELFVNLKNNHAQLNGLVNSVSYENEISETTTKFDDCSTTDSGAALEEDNCSGLDGTTTSSSHHESELQEDDEGIEINTGMDNNKCNLSNSNDSYIYELFAIMVHSGSASGGHYYAYIKDFDREEWFCFNDQCVTPITVDDIEKSFGGDSFGAGIYSSSTNAYMLMYRRLDSKKNERAMTIEEFPENLTKLLQYLNDSEQEEKKRRSETEILKPRVYFFNPKLKRMKDVKVYLTRDSTLDIALDTAYGLLKVEQFAPLSRCRLVAYDYIKEHIIMSFEGRENDTMENIKNLFEEDTEFLLEFCQENEEFEIYNTNGVTLNTLKIDINTFNLDGPYLLRFQKREVDETDVKQTFSKKFGIDCNSLVVSLSYQSFYYTRKLGKRRPSKALYAIVAEIESTREETEEILNKFAEEICHNLTYLYAAVPPTDKKSLEILSIPPYEPEKESDASLTPKQLLKTNNIYENISNITGRMNNTNNETKMLNTNVNSWLEGGEESQSKSLQFPIIGGSGGGHESEDSSLSDGDRTLVESAPYDFSNGSSPIHSPQLSSPEDENGEKIKNSRSTATEDTTEMENLYFCAIEIENGQQENSSHHSLTNGNVSDYGWHPKYVVNKMYKIYVDKRMSIKKFKYYLQSIIGVPEEHFKISCHCHTVSSYDKCYFNKGDQINIELERYLKCNEVKAKIYYLKLNQLGDRTAKLIPQCQHIIQTDKSLIDIKNELIAHLHKINPDYNTLKLDNCRLWRKWNRNLELIYDENSIADINQYPTNNCELIVQECEKHANMNTDDDTLTLFVRRLDLTELKLGEFDEITLEKNTDIKKALASISDIDENNIAYAIASSSFPFNDIFVLDVCKYDWNTESATKKDYPIKKWENGILCIYKNVEEQVASLTEKEEFDIRLQERKRCIDANNGNSSSLLSPRKEPALKIYVNIPSKSIDD